MGDVIDIRDIRKACVRKRKDLRDVAKIKWIFVHKSGGEGRDGMAGAVASSAFVVNKRGFPGPAYHYWVSRDGQVFQCAGEEERTWHTGGVCNDFGIGIALQGDTDRRDLTDGQKLSLRKLIEHLAESHDLDLAQARSWLGWHSRATDFGAKKNKSVCPGKFAVRLLEEWIEDYANRDAEEQEDDRDPGNAVDDLPASAEANGQRGARKRRVRRDEENDRD